MVGAAFFGAGYNGAEYDDFMRRSVTGRANVNQFNPRLNMNLGFFGNNSRKQNVTSNAYWNNFKIEGRGRSIGGR